MRDYGVFSPLFWTRGSGKRLRGDAVAQVVAAYLATAPTSNLIGIYYLPIVTICNDTGHDEKTVRDALARIQAVGFAFYDHTEELVWVPNHAEIQVGLELKEKDKRRAGVARAIRAYARHPFAHEFMARYGDVYALEALPQIREKQEAPSKGLVSPSKPLPRGYDPDPDPDPVSDLGSDLSPKHQTVVGNPVPARDPLPRHVANFEGSSWVAAYSQAVQSVLGEAIAWSFDPRWLRDLERVLRANSGEANRMGRETWIMATVMAFVTSKRDEGEYWMGFSPAGLAKWLNSGRPAAKPKAQPHRRRFGGPSDRDLTEPLAYEQSPVTTLADLDREYEEREKSTNGKTDV